MLNNTLYLEHWTGKRPSLEPRFAAQTLAYIAELWKHPVYLLTGDEHGREVSLTGEPTKDTLGDHAHTRNRGIVAVPITE